MMTIGLSVSLISVEQCFLFQRQNNIPHPGPVLLAVNNFGVEAAVPGDPLPLRPGLQAVHVRQEGLLGDPVLLLLDPHLLLVLLVPAGEGVTTLYL